MKHGKLGTVLMATIGALVVLPQLGESAAEARVSETTASDAAAAHDADSPSSGEQLFTPEGRSVNANLGLKPSVTPMEDVASTGPCAAGMVEVEGDHCANVEQKCLRFIDADAKMPLRCAEFEQTGRCLGKVTRKKFCIDKYEYPNVAGEKPTLMKTWYEAKDACGQQGKRLCGDSEWTLACEGQERLPYPYGYARNAEACNIDKPHPDVDEKALGNPATRAAEVARLDQRDPSGSHESCVSPFGVYDMTGNVDEWVVNESGAPYKSGLKGGYWGPVRTRCRPMTTAHNEQFSFYQIGFRCCADQGTQGTVGKAPGAAAGTTYGGNTGKTSAKKAAAAGLAGS